MSPSDPLPALERASYIRLYRAARKRELKDAANGREARERAAALIEDPPEELDAMRVLELLRSCRRLGHHSAAVLMQRAALHDQGKQIGALTARQRAVLCDLLRERPD